MNMRIFFIFLLVFLVSCSGSKNNELDENQSKSKMEGAFDAEIEAIEEELSGKGQLATSMRYTKDDNAYIVVRAHLNEVGNIIKIEEEYNEGLGKNNGITSFYLKDGKVFASKEYFNDVSPQKQDFVERISYYDKNQKVQKSMEKRVKYEEELEEADYQEVSPHQLTLDRAKRVLDQESEFETTFQGFVQVQALNYLIVGAKNSEGYVSSIRVDYEDSFIKTLLAEPTKYLNRKVFISFENVVDPTGFQYQTYLSGKFID